MAMPYPPDNDEPAPSERAASPVYEHTDEPPRVLRLRIVGWDVVATLLLWGSLLMAVTMTNWPKRLFGFTANICDEDTCGAVPFGIDFYIHPLVWGGVGAAIAAAVFGPFVSMLKGWYMSFWPALAVGVLLLTSVVGSVVTAFSQPYWH
jgi:hypothetical protein